MEEKASRRSWIGLVVFPILGVSAKAVQAGERFFWSRLRTCDHATIKDYGYESSSTLSSGSFRLVNREGDPAISSGLATESARDVLRKRFTTIEPPLEIEGLHCSRASAALNDSGVLTASCRLKFDGLLERSHRGVNAELQWNVFAGPAVIDSGESEGSLVWQAKKRLWVSTGQPQDVALLVGYSESRNQRWPGHGTATKTVPPKQNKMRWEFSPASPQILKDQFVEIEALELIIRRLVQQ